MELLKDLFLQAIQIFINNYLGWVMGLIVPAFFIFLSILGLIYGLGRMLGKVHSYKAKNTLAVVFSFIISFWYEYVFIYSYVILDEIPLNWILEFVGQSIMISSISCVFFVTIGWKFYNRVTSALEKKFPMKMKKHK